MLIIVEGCDGAGKSTFVESLAAELGGEVRHFGPPKQWAVSEYELTLQDYKPGSGHHIICDRFHVGELIYGPIYRDKSELAEVGYMHVQGWLRRLGAVMVYLDPPLAQVQQNVEARGDDYIDTAHIRDIVARYREIYRQEQLPSMVIRRYPTATDIATLIRYATPFEREAINFNSLTSFVGWPSPDVLFVGDEKSAMAGDHVQAFVPWPGRSGEFLLKAIQALNIETWGVINAQDDNVGEAVHILKPRRVLALGQRTNDVIAKIANAQLPHPAYAKRFLNMTPDSYAELMRDHI